MEEEEPPSKRRKVPSKESRMKFNAKRNKKYNERKQFIKMLSIEFPQSNLNPENICEFLFKLAGYDFNPSTWEITQRPSKFGGVWRQIEPVSSSVNQQYFKSSLLINERLIQLMNQPVCDRCGSVWKCKVAEGSQAQKNTNGVFHFSCSECGLEKYWSTQGEDDFLDDLLWVSCKLTGTSPTKLCHILRLLQTGYDEKQHNYGDLVANHVVPAIDQLYQKMQKQVMEEVKRVCTEKKIGATITWDGGYASRNNNSDHAVVDFVEHVTGKNMLLHLEMTKCSSQLLPQSAEKKLIVKGYKYIKEQGLPIARVGHDGKEITDISILDPTVAEDLDPWHFKKVEMGHYVEHCTNETKCVMGNKKLQIPADSKEVKEEKMRRRRHLLALREGLGFHLMRSCKWSKQSVHVGLMIWCSYLLHCLGCHIFCIDDQKGLESMGKSSCSINGNPPKIFDPKEYRFLHEFIFNPRLINAFPRLVYFTSSYPNESVWNLMGIYRDKTIHYKYYDVLYQMGYLDWNENRLRKVRYTYKTKVREWKIRHKKRYNRKILDKKTYMWQDEALAIIFPQYKEWFLHIRE